MPTPGRGVRKVLNRAPGSAPDPELRITVLTLERYLLQQSCLAGNHQLKPRTPRHGYKSLACAQEGRSEEVQRAFAVLGALMFRINPEDLPALVAEVLQDIRIRKHLEQAACLGKEPRLPLAIAATIPCPVLHYAHASLEASKKTKVRPCYSSCTPI